MKTNKNHPITKSLYHFITDKKAFTLAEVMVVLFVMTVILAAFAPMMTTRTKVHKTSPWNYASPDTANTYFGVGANQTVMIGQKTRPATDFKNRLTLNTSGVDQLHMLFKQGDNILGQLNLNNNNVILGGNTETISAGSYNTVVGVEAAKANTETSQYNTAIGYNALLLNTGIGNTAIGTGALQSDVSGNYSTAVGYNACEGLSSTYTTCLGAFSGPNAPTDPAQNLIYVGNTNSSIYLGTSTAANIYPYGGTELRTLIQSESSDIRLKNVKGENNDGLDKIKQLKTFNFTYKNDTKNTPHVGVMAQDLQKIFPDAVITDNDGYYRIRKEDMFYAMVNAIKELANKDNEKDLKIQALEKKNAELEARLEKLEEKLK